MNQLNWHQFFLLERPMQRRLQWQINKSTNQQRNKRTDNRANTSPHSKLDNSSKNQSEFHSGKSVKWNSQQTTSPTTKDKLCHPSICKWASEISNDLPHWNVSIRRRSFFFCLFEILSIVSSPIVSVATFKFHSFTAGCSTSVSVAPH